MLASRMGAGVLHLPNPTRGEEEGLAVGRPKREKGQCSQFLPPWLLKKHIPSLHLHWERKTSNIARTTPSSVGNTLSLVVFYIWFNIFEKCPFFFYMGLHSIWYSAISWTNFSSWQSPIKLTYRNETKGEKKREKRLCGGLWGCIWDLPLGPPPPSRWPLPPECLEVRVVLILSAFKFLCSKCLL